MSTPIAKTMILTLNAGSSSLKFALFECIEKDLCKRYHGLIDIHKDNASLTLSDSNGETIHSVQLTREQATAEQVINVIEAVLPDVQLTAVSHRLVHGGREFMEATIIDVPVIERLKALTPLAPLHLPAEIRGIESILNRAPDLLQVACFDTAFHHKTSPLAKLLPLPHQFYEEGIFRYGFHGLSYDYISTQLAADHGRTIVAHLGSGASACAIHNRQSVAHSMGFSTNEGLMMGSRSGSIDPGVVLYLLEERNYSIADVHALLFDQSGLLGVSGISADIRQLEKSDDPQAQLAIDFFCYRTAAEIGKLLPALGGIDSLVFTAGIGQHSALVREKTCAYLSWLGFTLDREANQQHQSVISTPNSQVSVHVIPTDEELMLAQHGLQCL